MIDTCGALVQVIGNPTRPGYDDAASELRRCGCCHAPSVEGVYDDPVREHFYHLLSGVGLTHSTANPRGMGSSQRVGEPPHDWLLRWCATSARRRITYFLAGAELVELRSDILAARHPRDDSDPFAAAA